MALQAKVNFLVNMKIRDKLLSFLLLIFSPLGLCAEHFHETLLGAVGAGNYSYYWLPQPGTVLLQLTTIEGDADLYVSCKNLKPTFEIDNHDFQSTTCGTEKIRVASMADRPVSIAVYGHPSHENSLYELKVDVFNSVVEDTYEEIHARDSKTAYFGKPTSAIPSMPAVKDDGEYEERSVFWTLLLHILQVLLDLLVD